VLVVAPSPRVVAQSAVPPSPGARIRLDAGPVPVGVDRLSFLAMVEYHAAGNGAELKKMLDGGRIFLLGAGAEVVVLEIDRDVAHIRVQPGSPHGGREGYM